MKDEFVAMTLLADIEITPPYREASEKPYSEETQDQEETDRTRSFCARHCYSRN